jgi:geranylgeranyl reductase
MYGKYDAVVVGGGPSGAIAAQILAAAGVKVSLFEKSFSKVKPCGGATPLKSFEEFNLPKKEITKKIGVLSSFSPAGKRLDIALNGRNIAMIERSTFDNTLRTQAAEAGADVIEAEFQQVQNEQGKIYLKVNEKGKEREIVTNFLVAADGINSRVASSVGMATLPSVYTIQEKVDVKAAEDFQHMKSCEFWFGSSHAPRFYSWVFPKRDYIDLGTAATQGTMLKELMKNFKMRRNISCDGTQRVYRLPLRSRDSLVRKNIVFVGDAAGLVMPLSYEGIYYALKSGKMAAEAIIKGDPKDYEKQWNKTFRKHFKLMNRLTLFMRSDRTIAHMFRAHENKDIQAISLKLILNKDVSLSPFFIYLKLLQRFLV